MTISQWLLIIMSGVAILVAGVKLVEAVADWWLRSKGEDRDR